MLKKILHFVKRYWLIIISIIYLIWPIDIIPDIFGPVGLIDDGGILIVAIIKEVVNFLKQRRQDTKSGIIDDKS